MSKIVKTLSIPMIDASNVAIEGSITGSVMPYVKMALFPGTAVRPPREVVIIIEVLEVD